MPWMEKAAFEPVTSLRLRRYPVSDGQNSIVRIIIAGKRRRKKTLEGNQ